MVKQQHRITEKEVKTIMDYVHKQHHSSEPIPMEFWKKMEDEKIVPFHWTTIKTHYNKNQEEEKKRKGKKGKKKKSKSNEEVDRKKSKEEESEEQEETREEKSEEEKEDELEQTNSKEDKEEEAKEEKEKLPQTRRRSNTFQISSSPKQQDLEESFSKTKSSKNPSSSKKSTPKKASPSPQKSTPKKDQTPKKITPSSKSPKSSQESGSRKRKEQPSTEEEEVQRPVKFFKYDRIDARNVIRDLSTKYEVHPNVVVYALYIYSGNVELTKDFLERKGVPVGHPWILKHDRLLKKRNSSRRTLFRNFSRWEIERRKEFLNL